MNWSGNNMRQCSLLTIYGQKSKEFIQLVEDCQQALEANIGNDFKAYNLNSIHATIIGFERSQRGILINRNFFDLRNEVREMDILGYADWLSKSPVLPFSVRIGGFSPFETPFLDHGMIPYERAFGIYGNKAVVIGWPVASEGAEQSSPQLIQSLAHLRRGASDFNILHAYHPDDSSSDNTFYFRIGLIENHLGERTHEIEQTLRHLISQLDPIFVQIGYDDLYLVSYVDQTLPVESTLARPIKDVNTDTLAKFYQDF